MVVYDYDGQISLLTEIKVRVRIQVSLWSTSVYYGREAAHDQSGAINAPSLSLLFLSCIRILFSTFCAETSFTNSCVHVYIQSR